MFCNFKLKNNISYTVYKSIHGPSTNLMYKDCMFPRPIMKQQIMQSDKTGGKCNWDTLSHNHCCYEKQ